MSRPHQKSRSELMGINDLSYTVIVAKEIGSFQDLGFPNMVNEWPHNSF